MRRRPERREHAGRGRRRESDHRAAISIVSTTEPSAMRCPSADTSLRCSSQRPDEAGVRRRRPGALVAHDRRSMASTIAGRPRRARAGSRRRRCRSGGRPRPRRRAAAPRASRRAAGCAGRRRGHRRSVGSQYAARASAGGAGWTRRRAPVMTPSVPSLPTNSWLRSGPTAARACAARVHDPTVGEHHVQSDAPCPRSCRSGSTSARAAARQPAAHGRQVDRLGPVAER